MQTPARLFARPVAIAVIAASLLGCGTAGVQTGPPIASPTTAPSASPAPAEPLVVVETRGGECPQGACGSTIAIEPDGRVHALDPAPAEVGTLTDVTRDALATEIAKADFARLKNRAFTDECPTAFDGQETVYSFTTGSGTERIASCEFVVDPEDPLFVAVAAALAEAAAP